MDALGYIIMRFAMNFVEALALPSARVIVPAWVWLYTLAAPQEERESRRAEMRSDLYEQVDADQSEGLSSTAIAIRVFGRMLCGLPGDVAWALPYLPATLARGLMRGSEIITRPEILKALIGVLTVLSVFNVMRIASGDSWTTISVSNVGMLIGVVFVWKRHRSWARRTIYLFFGLVVVVTVGLLVWVVIQNRLYQLPVFWPLTLSLLSVLLAMEVGDKPIRVRVFGGRWRPVVMYWALIAATSLIAASFVTGGIVILLTVWGLAAMVALSHAMLGVMMLVVALVLYGGLRLTAVGMRCMAKGIQRVS